MNLGLSNPMLAVMPSPAELGARDWAHYQLLCAIETGILFIDALADGLVVPQDVEARQGEELAYAILQAARARFTRTEYISCPGCGRTLYDLEGTIARVKAATSHFKGLKIAIMGCIVNGPGEMADADYGYVGAARGRVSLYRRKECVERNIPEEEAVQRLLEIIQKEIQN